MTLIHSLESHSGSGEKATPTPASLSLSRLDKWGRWVGGCGTHGGRGVRHSWIGGRERREEWKRAELTPAIGVFGGGGDRLYPQLSPPWWEWAGWKLKTSFNI